MNWKFWQKKQMVEVITPRVWRITLEVGNAPEQIYNIIDLYDTWMETNEIKDRVKFWITVYEIIPELRGIYSINVEDVRTGFKFTEDLKDQ